MSLKDLVNKKEGRIAQVRKNLTESNIAPELVDKIVEATEVAIDEATEELETAIKESEEAKAEAEKAIKESEEAKAEADKIIKESEEAEKKPMNESTKAVIGALVNLEVSSHMQALKEMKEFDKQREAVQSLAESVIKILDSLNIDVISDANRALVEAKETKYNELLNKHNQLIDKSNKQLRESNIMLAKVKGEHTRFKEQATENLLESVFTGATAGLTLLEQDKVKSLVESKEFADINDYAVELKTIVASLHENKDDASNPLVTKKLNENALPKSENKPITSGVKLTGSIFS